MVTNKNDLILKEKFILNTNEQFLLEYIYQLIHIVMLKSIIFMFCRIILLIY